MKKYFIKILASFVLVAIWLAASSFCFHDLLSPIVSISEAKAAAISDSDNCGHHEVQENKTNQQSSLLPCCTSNIKSVILSQNQQLKEVVEFFPFEHFNKYEIIKTILVAESYHKPNISPPELSSLLATVIRV